MAVAHQIIKVQLGLDELASDQSKISAYVAILNEEGKNGWQAYHVAEVNDALLVFMQNPSA